VKFFAVLTISASLLFVGCSSEVPDCNDSETKDLVLEITYDELIDRFGPELANITELSLEAVRTTDTNKRTGNHSCAADLRIKQDSHLRKQNSTAPITYTVELANDGDDFYVTVYGL
tara:strand:+ start:26728 stop:27078 length:351 start_codon:yes stop_codon:yes gene_type:complete